MFLNSIRWRLQLWHGLLLVVVLAGFGLTAYQLQRSNQLRRIDQELQRRMAVIGGVIRRPGDGPVRPPLDHPRPPSRPADDRFVPPGRNQGAEQLDRRPPPPPHPDPLLQGEGEASLGLRRPHPPHEPAARLLEKASSPQPSPPEEERASTPAPLRFEGPQRDLGSANPLPQRESQGEGESAVRTPEGAEIPRAPFEGPPRVEPEPPLGLDPAVRDFLPPAPVERRLSAQDLNLFEGSATNAFYYVVWTRDGRPLARSDSAPLEVSHPARGPEVNETRMRGTLRELFRYTPPGECLLVGKDIGRELSDLRRFAGLLLGAGGAVLSFGLAGGWWLSTRAIRPIKDISATASKIWSGDLSQRIPAADTDNELGQLASVLNSTFTRLETAFEQQARFTADAAHELRTPVSVMLTQTQSALTRDRPPAEYRETVEACQRAAQRMRRLIESLLELARLDAQQEPMKRDRFDLAHTTAECLELVRPLAAERSITIRAELPATECRGDADRLALAITNLLTNAIHYNKDGGEIRISAARDQGAAILRVADTGQGISAEDLPHIFERFWRADPSRSRANGRTGLGLAIAKSIVDAHGGSIEVASELDNGSTFTLRLPGPPDPAV